MYQIHWGEASGGWTAEQPASALLALLEANPFGPFSEMDLNELGRWQPYDREQALAALRRGKEPSLGVRDETKGVQGDITRSVIQNNINLYAPEHLVRSVDPEEILTLMRRVAECLPIFLESIADVRGSKREYDGLRDLPNLPAFNLSLGWAHVVSPRGLAPYYLPEDILHAPAYRVRQLASGLIEMVVYPHPLDYQTPQGRERIIELTRYLDAHRRDRPQAQHP